MRILDALEWVCGRSTPFNKHILADAMDCSGRNAHRYLLALEARHFVQCAHKHDRPEAWEWQSNVEIVR